MARKHEAERLLRQGLDPMAISQEMDVSFSTVVQYLRTRVGERALRHSDLYFSFGREKRKALQAVLEAQQDNEKIRLSNDLSWEELYFFKALRDRRIFAGDMYEYISEIEIALHDVVRATLVSAFG